MPRILYATDGSEGALAGAHLLRALPLGNDSEVRLLSVLAPGAKESDAETALTAAQEALRDTAARVTRSIRRGNTAAEILAAAEEPTDLIVVGTRGMSAIPRFFLGSVAEKVARHAPCPALLARPLRGGKLDRVVLGVDGSSCAAFAAAWLRAFPLPTGCEVRLVAAVTSAEAVRSSSLGARMPALAAEMRAVVQMEHKAADQNLQETKASFAGAEGLTVTTERREDDAASALLAAVEERQADVLVVGSQGLSGVDRFLLGSVSEKVLRHAPCSVLVVREPHAAAPPA